MIRFIYFDIGDVMFGGKALAKINNKLGTSFDDFLKIYSKHNDKALRGQVKTQEVWETYRKELGLDIHIPNYCEYFVQHLEPILPMHNLAKELAKKYDVGLFTNLYEGYLEEMIKQRMVPSLDYKAIIKSCDVGYIKPEEEIYAIAEEKSGVNPKEILFIDDQEKNVNAALDREWKSVLFDLSKVEESIMKITAQL